MCIQLCYEFNIIILKSLIKKSLIKKSLYQIQIYTPDHDAI